LSPEDWHNAGVLFLTTFVITAGVVTGVLVPCAVAYFAWSLFE
jgi:hypothetical protein